MRQYELGKFLRKRYYKLLGDGKYSPDKIYVQSSNMDRAIISAAANLAALFPRDKDQVWNDELPNWLPTPIHTIPEELDHTIALDTPCPRYDKALNDYLTSTELYGKLDVVKPYFKLIEENSGFTNLTIFQLVYTWDTLNSQQWANLTLVGIVFNDIKQTHCLHFD